MKRNFFSINEIFKCCSISEKQSFLVNDSKLKNILETLVLVNEVRSFFYECSFVVTSWCRDSLHNKRVGGQPTSQHLTGGAVDFKVYKNGVCKDEYNRAVYERIQELGKLNMIEYGQCIWYHSDKAGHFIHLSIPGTHNNQYFEKQ